MMGASSILLRVAGALLVAWLIVLPNFRIEGQDGAGGARVIEVLADHDSRYKVAGMRMPEITAKAGERLKLRITAKKAKNVNREGSIHGFTLLRAKDRTAVAGWDFQLVPGTQGFAVTAPEEPGEYVVICTVICSDDHEGMTMRFVVLP
jgi:heme/copper-type cytochrome/quinol oxidase subunit 2